MHIYTSLNETYQLKQCIHMCIRTRAYARARARVLHRFSTVLVMHIH